MVSGGGESGLAVSTKVELILADGRTCAMPPLPSPRQTCNRCLTRDCWLLVKGCQQKLWLAFSIIDPLTHCFRPLICMKL